jgi:hypothetical protein
MDTMKLKHTTRIQWSIKNCYVLSIDRRFRVDQRNEEEEYAVVKVGTLSDFDDITEKPTADRIRVKFVTLMCFDGKIFSRIQTGESYSFTGKVGFGYGSTFFTIEKVFLFGELITTVEQKEVEGEEGEPPSPSLETSNRGEYVEQFGLFSYSPLSACSRYLLSALPT